MRYMMLIYSDEMPEGSERSYEPHRALIDEATRAGVFVAAEPLAPPSSTTTLQIEDGRTLITDGPFVESKEQLGGYYIFDCENLDHAIEWAAKIHSACTASVSIEIRPMPGMPPSKSRNDSFSQPLVRKS
jgi:hypothetical protein